MRDYSKISPLFWAGDTGRRIRGAGKDCQIAALYLLSCPSSNMIGLFYLPLATMAHETGLTKGAATKALQRLADLDFARWDQRTESVFVMEMAAHQIGEPLSAGDKRCKGVEREWSAFKTSPFYRPFYDRYAASFHLPRPQNGRPSKAPSKPLRSHEQEQEQEHLPVQDGANQQGTSDSVEGPGAQIIPMEGRAAR